MNLKMKSWKGGDIKGNFLVTWKLDGVCVILDGKNRTAMSKHGKPLYGFDYIFEFDPTISGVYEVYRENWETSVSLVRTQDTPRAVQPGDLYRLDPPTAVLRRGYVDDPSDAWLTEELSVARSCGYEGLVLVPVGTQFGMIKANAQLIKVKPKITVDVRVTGIQPGTGKHEGRMGALITEYGKVGTGFTDEARSTIDHLIIDKIIEVELMEWTKDKKMRHPRFLRVRWDKAEENLEGLNNE